MAIVKERNGILHIQWYDPLTKKNKTKSTGLSNSVANQKKAKKIAEELQIALRYTYKGIKAAGVSRTSIKSAFEHFLKNNSDKNPKTIYDYNRFYKKFSERFDENMESSLLTKNDIEDFLIELKKLTLAKNSIHNYGKQVNHFMNFLFEYSYCQYFKINRNMKTKPEVGEKFVFDNSSLKKIFTGLEGKTNNFKVTVFLLFYTGLRPSDLMTLTTHRINFEEEKFSYYSPKRKKYREVPFHSALVDILKRRVEEIGDGKIIEYAKTENMSRAIGRYFNTLELNPNYTTRTFRKTFITLCRNIHNIDATIVRELVGHEQGNTMDRYYNKIGIKEMKQELEKLRIPE